MRGQHQINAVELRSAGGAHRHGERRVLIAGRLSFRDGCRIEVGYQFTHGRSDCLGKMRDGGTHYFDGKVAGKFN